MREIKMTDEQICQVLNISKDELIILLKDQAYLLNYTLLYKS